jgi:hypothetical protein
MIVGILRLDGDVTMLVGHFDLVVAFQCLNLEASGIAISFDAFSRANDAFFCFFSVLPSAFLIRSLGQSLAW